VAVLWVWRRCLFAWEEECVRECCALLHDIVLQDHTMDRWRWLLDPVLGYTVKGAYHLLTSVEEPPARGLFDDLWHKHVPLKVSLFAWRLLHNRLPTHDNLVRRRVLHHDANQCVGGMDGKLGWTHRVGPFNPSFLVWWVEILNQPQVGCLLRLTWLKAGW